MDPTQNQQPQAQPPMQPQPQPQAQPAAHGRNYDWQRQAYAAVHPGAAAPAIFTQPSAFAVQQLQAQTAHSQYPNLPPVADQSVQPTSSPTPPERHKHHTLSIVVGIVSLLFGLAAAFVLLTRQSPYDAASQEFALLERRFEQSSAEQLSTFFVDSFEDLRGEGLSTEQTRAEGEALGTILEFIVNAYSAEGDASASTENIKALNTSGIRVSVFTKQLRFDGASTFMTVAFEENDLGQWPLTRIQLWAREPSESEKLTLARGDYGEDAIPARLRGLPEETDDDLQRGDPNAGQFPNR